MKLCWRVTAAVLAYLGLLLIQAAHAQSQREYQAVEYQAVNDAAERAGESLVSYDSFESCECEYCGSEGCCGDCASGSCGSGDGGGLGLGLGASLLGRPGRFFAGAEYIYARASFSEALAFVASNVNSDVGANFVEYDFDYESSYRFFGGYQFCDCGGAIAFDYARYRSGGSFAATEGPFDEFFAMYEIENDGVNNETLAGDAQVAIDSYDISISRTIPLGSPLCASACPGCGDGCDCCNSCGDGWCPAWDITWSAGLRFADVGWSRRVASTEMGTGTLNGTSDTRLGFEGAGARIGLLGRRYFGRRGLLSVYAKADLSLLVGNMSISTDRFQNIGIGVARIYQNSARRVIPVTEIEAGLSAHLGNHIMLTSGYFISAWHDLGMRDTYAFENPVSGGLRFPINHFDDANILGFDGFFARAEIAY